MWQELSHFYRMMRKTKETVTERISWKRVLKMRERERERERERDIEDNELPYNVQLFGVYWRIVFS